MHVVNKYVFFYGAAVNLVEMFNCIVDTVEDSSSVRSYRKFLIANFCYNYIHKQSNLQNTITLKVHHAVLKFSPVATSRCRKPQQVHINTRLTRAPPVACPRRTARAMQVIGGSTKQQ